MTDTLPTESAPSVHTIYNCERCLRQFTTEGAPAGQLILFTSPPGKIVVPDELFQCGTAECDLIFQANLQLDATRAEQSRQRRANWRQKHLPPRKGNQRQGKTAPVSVPRASCTEPYKDAPDDSRLGPDARGGQQESEAEVQAQLDPASEEALDDFLRVRHLGRWFTNQELAAELVRRKVACLALHSVISRLRARYRAGGQYVLPLRARQNETSKQLAWYCVHRAAEEEPFLENRQGAERHQ